MRIIETYDDIQSGLAHLRAVEPRFGPALDLAGPVPLRRREEGFAPLLDILVSQQLSVASADSVLRKLKAAGLMTPEAVLAAEDEAMRACGLSRPKIRYARAAAEAVRGGALDFAALPRLPVAVAAAKLTAITGIGPWTAEIYLMFCIGHADVFAPGDLALQEAAKMMLSLEARPDAKTMARLAEPWAPWRAVAARALWAYYRVAKGREGVAG